MIGVFMLIKSIFSTYTKPGVLKFSFNLKQKNVQ